MLLVSIDYFDVVIASHGLHVAHEMLSIVGDRLDEVIRPDDATTRHDDGFLILWAPGPGAPEVGEIASRIASRFNEPAMTSIGKSTQGKCRSSSEHSPSEWIHSIAT